MVATDIPQEVGTSSRVSDAAALPAAPPIITAPSDADHTSFPDLVNDYGAWH